MRSAVRHYGVPRGTGVVPVGRPDPSAGVAFGLLALRAVPFTSAIEK